MKPVDGRRPSLGELIADSFRRRTTGIDLSVVPAHAGTTAESPSPHTIISFSSLPECSGTSMVTPITIATINSGAQRNDSENDPEYC